MKTFSHCCEALRRHCDDPDLPVIFVPKFCDYGINVLDGGSSFIKILFYPWSGHKLPESLKYEWFRRLEAQGLDPGIDPIPLEFQDEQWYMK